MLLEFIAVIALATNAPQSDDQAPAATPPAVATPAPSTPAAEAEATVCRYVTTTGSTMRRRVCEGDARRGSGSSMVGTIASDDSQAYLRRLQGARLPDGT